MQRFSVLVNYGVGRTIMYSVEARSERQALKQATLRTRFNGYTGVRCEVWNIVREIGYVRLGTGTVVLRTVYRRDRQYLIHSHGTGKAVRLVNAPDYEFEVI